MAELHQTQRRRWYAVHVLTGQEEKVRQLLERRVKARGLEGKIVRIVIPKEQDKGWQGVVRERRVFPGYILLEMVLDEETWHLVRWTPGVTGFVGVQEGVVDKRTGVPMVQPLREQEVETILRMVGEEAARPRPIWHKGEMVRIRSGPFSDTVGRVEEVNTQRQTLIVMVNLLGRETPVEVDFSHVERV